MQPHVELPFIEAGLYLCYMNYHATGEGVTSCISVAGSAQRAEDLIKDKLPAYFHAGLVTALIDADANDDIMQMIEWIPSQVKAILTRIPRGAGECFSELHYNLS